MGFVNVVGRFVVGIFAVAQVLLLSSCSVDSDSGDTAASNEATSVGGASNATPTSTSTSTNSTSAESTSAGCTPTSCAAEGAECGVLDDGCGSQLACGECEAPLSCAGDGTPNRCTQAYGWVAYTTQTASYDIQGIWGPAPDQLWAVAGGGTLLGGAGQLHAFDGAVWDIFYSMGEPGYTDVHGVGQDVFIVGHGPQLLWFDGFDLYVLEGTDSSFAANTSVWASAPDAVWVGNESTSTPLRFWNGVEFDNSGTAPRSPNLAPVRALWGTAANDVWAVDDEGVLHFDGTEWTQAYATTATFTGLHGSGPSDVWAVGPRAVAHFDGVSWSEHPDGLNQAINDVWVAAPDDVWFVGADGKVMHGGVAGFTSVPSGITDSLFAVWGTGPQDIWAGGVAGTLIHYEPVASPTEPVDPADCNPQGFGCSETPCCSPFVCAAFAGLLVCQ